MKSVPRKRPRVKPSVTDAQLREALASPEHALWRLEVAERDAMQVLLEWARQSLPGPVVPCSCTDGRCVRCRVAAVIEGTAPPAGPLFGGYDETSEPSF